MGVGLGLRGSAGPGVPVGDLLGQPVAHGRSHLAHPGQDVGSHLGQMGGHGHVDRVHLHRLLGLRTEPGVGEQAAHEAGLGRGQRPVVEVGRVARRRGGAVGSKLHELEASGHDLAAQGRLPPVGDRVLQQDQEPNGLGGVGVVGEDGALPQHGLQLVEGEGEHRLEEGVAGGQQLGRRQSFGAGVLLVERDPLVAVEDHAPADRIPGRLPDGLGDTQHLEATGLPLGHPSSEALESVGEPGPDVVRLQPAGLCLQEVTADALHVDEVEGVAGQGQFVHQLGQAVADGRVDHLVETGPHLRVGRHSGSLR